MSMQKSLQNLKYDVRLREYNLNRGVLTKQELEQHLGQLSDVSTNSLPLDIEEGSNGADSSEDHH